MEPLQGLENVVHMGWFSREPRPYQRVRVAGSCAHDETFTVLSVHPGGMVVCVDRNYLTRFFPLADIEVVS